MCAIKYIYLLLSTILVLASCSSLKFDDLNNIEFNNEKDGKATFNDLRYDMIRHIATFIEPEDIVNWRYVNCLTLSSLSLKRLVQQTFNISGLESIADNEAELAGVMRFAYICHDHLLLFKAFMKEVVWEKKPYVFLFSPLMLHLLRTFRELGAREKQEYQHYFKRKFKNNVECYIIKVCLKKGHFNLVFGIVNNNNDLFVYALESAARLGNSNIVELLLHSRTDISADYIGRALFSAARGGHTSIVELLLQSRNDIPADYVNYSLCNAARAGHRATVELLLQSGTNIPVTRVGWALRNAAKKRHTPIVELLLQNRTDIPADDVGRALCIAAGDGHRDIVELLLLSGNDIHAVHVGRALRNAAKKRCTAIVELFLLHRTDIPANHVDHALRNAARCGNKAIVELITYHRKDIEYDSESSSSLSSSSDHDSESSSSSESS
jgi:ankyrin repeat protein